MTSSAILLLLLLTGSALPLEEEPAWRDGMQLLDEFRYEEALQRLQPLADDDARPAGERARAHVRSGMIHADLRREDEARRHFHSALSLDARASLPEGSSPRLQALFEDVRRSLPPPAAPAAPAETEAADTKAPDTKAPDTKAPDTSSAPAPLPASDAPGEATGAAALDDAAAAEGLSGSDLVMWGLTAGGALLVIGGAAAWGSGLGLYALADDAHFQEDAVRLGEAGAWSQIAGQGVLAAGALFVAGGALMLSVQP